MSESEQDTENHDDQKTNEDYRAVHERTLRRLTDMKLAVHCSSSSSTQVLAMRVGGVIVYTTMSPQGRQSSVFVPF